MARPDHQVGTGGPDASDPRATRVAAGTTTADAQRDLAALTAMLDTLPERIVRFRRDDLLVRWCNVAKAADLGVRPEEVVGHTLDRFLTPEVAAQVRADVARLGPQRPTATQREPLRRPGEPERWIEWVDRWHPQPTGDEIVSVGRDVTDQHVGERALRESEQRFRLAMADAPVGMALVSLDGRIEQANAALCTFLGRALEEVVGSTVSDLTHPGDLEADLAYGQEALAGRVTRQLEKRYVRPDGSVVWGGLKVSVVRDADGRPEHLIGQVVDLTDRVRYEEELRRSVAAERHIADGLRQLERVETAFLTAVSHELRTPLTVVRGMISTLRRVGHQITPQVRQEMEEAIEAQSIRLTVLVDELVDVERLSRGAVGLERRAVDTARVVADAVAASEVGERVSLHAPSHLPADVDADLLHRIVDHLLDNVAKYAPDGAVDVRLAAERGGVRLEVRDRGPGIAAAHREHVFEPFHRAVDHPRPGTGIGLALVAEFARLHGGRAWAEPAADGAHLVVTLAATGDDGPPRADDPAPPA